MPCPDADCDAIDFETAFDLLIGHEGGYVYHPNDPGGETKYGISKRSYPDVDIYSLTLEDAKRIYERDFWDRLQISSMPEPIRFQLFDTAVNSGPGQAVRFLQRAANVADDGIIGPMTISAVRRLSPYALLARFNGERLDYMTRLSTWPTFGKGWARRIAQNLRMAG